MVETFQRLFTNNATAERRHCQLAARRLRVER